MFIFVCFCTGFILFVYSRITVARAAKLTQNLCDIQYCKCYVGSLDLQKLICKSDNLTDQRSNNRLRKPGI